MKTPQLALILLGAIILCGCKGREADPVLESTRVDRIYRSNDVRAAERALLAERQNLIAQHGRNVRGIDYDTSLGIVDGRLFLIYEHLGDSNHAFLFGQESISNYNNGARRRGLDAGSFDFARLRQLILKSDSASPVAWGSNEQNTSKPVLVP